MKTSKRKFEGCVIIDHRDSPGITPDEANGHGPAVGKGQVWESATYSCVHCQRVVIMNPLRSRPRVYCPKCDDYVCDVCEAQRVLNPQRPHKSFAQIIEEVQQAGAKGVSHGLILPL
jgi:hypothetical protein